MCSSDLQGKLFDKEDYVFNLDEKKIAVVLGANYQEYFEIGDKIDMQFYGIDVEAEVKGILKPNTVIKTDETYEHLRRHEISMIVQYFALINDLNVYENVTLPLKYQKKRGKDIKNKVYDVLEQLSLADKKLYYPDELSGGEKQRVAIARAIVTEPKVILADEPTGALGMKNTIEVLEILKKLHERGCTMIIATHDLKVANYCDRIYYLDNGKIVLQ